MEKVRYHLLDEIRGFAVLCMIFFHGFYAVGMIFNYRLAYTLIRIFDPAEPYFAALFIFISGVCSTLSSSNFKNFLRLALVAVGISLVTVVGGDMLGLSIGIYFGVIHCIALCLLCAAALDKIPMKLPVLWLVVAALLFAVCYEVVFLECFFPVSVLGSKAADIAWDIHGSWWLLWLGFPSASVPYMADYFPFIPWVFMFIMGRAAAKMVKKDGAVARLAQRRICRPLGFMGRHALWFYIGHQPLIFGVCILILKFTGGSI